VTAHPPEGRSLLPNIWDCGSASHRGTRYGGRRVTGIPTADAPRLLRAAKTAQRIAGPNYGQRRTTARYSTARIGPLPRYIVGLGLPTIKGSKIACEPSYDYRLIHVSGMGGLACCTPDTVGDAGGWQARWAAKGGGPTAGGTVRRGGESHPAAPRAVPTTALAIPLEASPGVLPVCWCAHCRQTEPAPWNCSNDLPLPCSTIPLGPVGTVGQAI